MPDKSGISILPSFVRITSPALPDAARRESPDHHAELRVSGEKSDIAGLLLCEHRTIRAAGLARAALDGAEGQTVKRHYKPRYEACSAVDGASTKLLADGVLLHRKMFAIYAEFHVELPFEVRVRLNYTGIWLVCVGVYPPVSVDCVPRSSQPIKK